MKKIFIIVLSILLLVGCNNKEVKDEKLTREEEIIKMVDNNEVILVDVRSAEEYKVSHLKNSINIPVEAIITTFQTEVTMDKESHILVYCKSGVRAENAVTIFKGMGYTNTESIGGINNWKTTDYIEVGNN